MDTLLNNQSYPNPQPSPEGVRPRRSYKKIVLISAVSILVIITAAVVVKKLTQTTPQEDLTALEAASTPTTKTIEERGDQLSKLRGVNASVVPAENSAEKAKQKTN